MRFASLSAVAVLALAGCGGSGPDIHRQGPSPTPTPAPLTHERFSLSAAVPGAEYLGGVSVDPSNGHLWVLASAAGLAELDLEGHLLSLTKFEAEGLVDRGFVDLARLADGSFVLATSSEALHYKPDTRALETYFCLEPGWGLDYTVNKAVVADPAGGRIFAAPARYQGGGLSPMLLSAGHAQYKIADGSFIATNDVMESGVLAEGLAFLQSGELLAVQGTTLYRFDMQGKLHQSVALEGVTEATGLAYDAAHDQLWVTDGAARDLHRFDRKALLSR
jgi:hypothetical protein